MNTHRLTAILPLYCYPCVHVPEGQNTESARHASRGVRRCNRTTRRSAEDAAAEARHIGWLDGLQQEILGSLLQAPDGAETCQRAGKRTACMLLELLPLNRKEYGMHGRPCHGMDTDLLILVGTFSEDMITTGISLSLDDPCMHPSHFHRHLKQVFIFLYMHDLSWSLARNKRMSCDVLP